MTTKLITHSGRVVDLLAVDPGAISITDVTAALSYAIRWNGCFGAMTVAQHSCAVAEDLKQHDFDAETQLYGLLHDAAEAYLADLVMPAKRALPARVVLPDGRDFSDFDDLEERVLRAVYVGLMRFPPSARQQDEVKAADRRVAAFEARNFSSVAWKEAAARVAPGFCAPPRESEQHLAGVYEGRTRAYWGIGQDAERRFVERYAALRAEALLF